jgi:5-(carboxyamino)imidazole ribonucleotide synthase
MSNEKVILPGSTIGVLGSGQLGRMLAIAAKQMGYRVAIFSPEADTPAGQVADREVVADYNDLDAVAAFAKSVDVVTFEFENIPFATAETAAKHAIVRPDGRVLHTTQHRLREKTFLSGNGFPVTPYRAVRTKREVEAAFAELGPGILKTAAFGYDGKGQSKIMSTADISAAVDSEMVERVYEKLVTFEREVSVIGARGIDGTFAHWGVIENQHADHILDLSISPADVPEAVRANAVEIARAVLEKLGVVGVLCVEFFLTASGELIINELAPRPHNSGHLTINACHTSQFEQQLRAVCRLPLGSTEQLRPAAMAQLLGNVWEHGTPAWAEALKMPGVSLHLYGKAEPRPARKMGHLNVLADTTNQAVKIAIEVRTKLSNHNK